MKKLEIQSQCLEILAENMRLMKGIFLVKGLKGLVQPQNICSLVNPMMKIIYTPLYRKNFLCVHKKRGKLTVHHVEKSWIGIAMML